MANVNSQLKAILLVSGCYAASPSGVSLQLRKLTAQDGSGPADDGYSCPLDVDGEVR